MHRFMERNKPGFERFLVGHDSNGQPIFSSTEKNCYLTDADIVVPSGSDVLWAGPRSLRSNVIVESGAKLTISCGLGMPEVATITVKTGGELFVDGARIYSNCDGTFWNGIVVEGDATLGDSQNGQGFCRLVNADIETAHIGVNCEGTPGTYNWGGIVQGTFTTFLNCEKNAVEINGGLKKPLPGYSTGEGNYFYFCQFLRDASYFGSAYAFESMVTLSGVRGIEFVGCNFTNTYDDQVISRRGEGILSYNGGFSLRGIIYSGTEVPATISGFRQGIRALNLYNKAIKVTNSSFSDNWFGIYANNCNNAMILKNDFSVGSKATLDYSLPSGQPAFAGLALVRSRGFKVEENDFKRLQQHGTGAVNPVGIQVYGSGRYYNEIYKNTFKDLEVANLA